VRAKKFEVARAPRNARDKAVVLSRGMLIELEALTRSKGVEEESMQPMLDTMKDDVNDLDRIVERLMQRGAHFPMAATGDRPH